MALVLSSPDYFTFTFMNVNLVSLLCVFIFNKMQKYYKCTNVTLSKTHN